MQMTFRWYGDGNDDITPEMIRQIPGVSGLVWALHNKQPGEIWTVEEIEKVRTRIEGAGFHMDVVESVNVHDDIKIGLPTRDQYIENYKTTLKNLAKFGVKVVTYNFMPIFDWTRTDLFHPLEDGSNALYYEKSKIHGHHLRYIAFHSKKRCAYLECVPACRPPGHLHSRTCELHSTGCKWNCLAGHHTYHTLLCGHHYNW